MVIILFFASLNRLKKPNIKAKKAFPVIGKASIKLFDKILPE